MKIFNVVKNFVSYYKTYILILVIIFASTISIIYTNINGKSRIVVNDNELEIDDRDNKIAVYITGEVVNPGVYYIDENLRLDDLVKECGGLTSQADLSEINLAEKLNDSDKIDIPKIAIEEENEENNIENNDDNDLININKASKDELKTLNGIGDTLADNIIEYRKNNKFNTIEDILEVNGIGESKFENIKEYICVN